jgi:hypothetical protein
MDTKGLRVIRKKCDVKKDTEWIEEEITLTRYSINQVYIDDYQFLLFSNDEKDNNISKEKYNKIYQSLMIRTIENDKKNYLVRLEMAFDIFDLNASNELSNQIHIIDRILNSMEEARKL